jgi:type II secretory pathway component PulK
VKTWKRIRGHLQQRGAALLAVLFIIGLLIALVSTTLLLVKEDVDTVSIRRQMFLSRMYAEMGLAVAAHPDIKPDDPLLRREFYPGEGYIVTMRGEDGRMNPNLLLQQQDTTTLIRVFQRWGLKLQEAQLLLANLQDWIDQDPFTRTPLSWEARQYNIPGYPFNRPFRTVDEMSLVHGMDYVERIYPNWREWFSTFASGTLDVNEASAEVLSAVTGADAQFTQDFIKRRLGKDGIRHTLDDSPYPDVLSALSYLRVSSNPQQAQSLLSVQSSITRVECVGVVGDFRRTLFAVLNRSINPLSTGGVPGAAPVDQPTPVQPGNVAGAVGGSSGGGTSILWLSESDSRLDNSSEKLTFAKQKAGR